MVILISDNSLMAILIRDYRGPPPTGDNVKIRRKFCRKLT